MMDLKYWHFFAILAIIGVTQCNASTDETPFDNYEMVLKQLTNFEEKLRLIKAVWGEIRADHEHDVRKATSVYNQLSMLLKTISVDEPQRPMAHLLHHQIEDHLIAQNVIVLSSLLAMKPAPCSAHETDYLCHYLLAQHDSQLLEHIFRATIERIFQVERISIMASYFHNITWVCALQAYRVDAVEALILAQIYTHEQYAKWGFKDEKYLYELSYYLRNQQKNPLYQQIRKSVQQQMHTTVSMLPSSLQYLFFEPSYCLLNRKYNEFVYTTTVIPIDDDNIHIFTWKETNEVGPNGAWITHTQVDVDDSTLGLNITVALQSKLTQKFMYLVPHIKKFVNIVASWKPGEARRPESYWTVKLLDGHLIFEQNGLMLCASTAMFNKDRRFVLASSDNKNAECQWKAMECPTE